ncbi:MAG: tetratricopeptide repeat protein, partial [Deefgea sp.]
MSKRRAIQIPAITLLFLTLNTPAHANRITEEWRNFRTFPRIERAYDLLRDGDLVGARRLFEQVYQISPNRKDITLELARICARQADIACIQRLANSWSARKPNDALGYMLNGYIGYLTQNDTLVIKYAPLALQRTGASEAYRSSLAEAWLAALIRQDNAMAIGQAKQLIKAQNINVAGHKLKQWEQQRQAAQLALKAAPPTRQPETTEEPIAVASPPPQTSAPTKIATSKPITTQAATPKPTRQSTRAPQRTRPASPSISPQDNQENAVSAIPQFPYSELNQAERNIRLTTHLHALAEQQQHSAFLNTVTRLKADHLFTPALQASLAKALQSQHCDLLLAITPVESSSKLTTPHSQMAAAFCSKNDPTRAAGHFAAVNQLQLQANEAPNLIALRGEGDALMAAGQTELAMQRWYQLLQLENQAQLGQTLANLALQHPQFEISNAIAKRFPQYFPSGALALQQARQAAKQGDPVRAMQFFYQSLEENPDANVWYELALLHQREQRHAQQGKALAQAVKRAPDNALFRAEYGFWLISTEQHVAALDNLQHAIELDPTRIELQPQIAFLQMQQGNNEAAIIDLRASIDQYAAIQERMGISGDAAAQQLFNWQRNVQTLED